MRLRCPASIPAFTCAIAIVAILHGQAEPMPGSGQSQPRLNLGVLRADGILMPFASFDGDDWRASWPADLFGRELPASVGDVPREWWGGFQPDTWRLAGREDVTPAGVKLVAPVRIMTGRHRRLGLRTDYPPANAGVPPFAVPYPKIGLAVAGDVRIESIASVSRLSPAFRELLPGLRPALAAAEERTVNGLASMAGWRHPVDRKARDLVVPELEAWYMAPLPEPQARVSYIEAVKKYPPGPKDEGCGLETFISGWVWHDDAATAAKTKTAKAALKASVMYCDRDKASYMMPLGRVELRNRIYWIYQMSGRDHEWYVVAEPTKSRTRVVVEYLAGGLLF